MGEGGGPERADFGVIFTLGGNVSLEMNKLCQMVTLGGYVCIERIDFG